MPFANYAFTILDSVDSTNNYAMAKVHAGLAMHGDAYFAVEQTGGKGQRGKTWLTGNGQNIALSIVLKPKHLPVAEQFKLSAVVALACYDFFSKYAGDETSIKWPNDIFWRDRKAGGILIENVIGKARPGHHYDTSTSNLWKYAVAGIGININQSVFHQSLSNVVSLKQVTGKDFDVVELAKELQYGVIKKAEKLATGSFDKILAEYNSRLFKRNCMVRLKKGNVEFDTLVKAVTKEGNLYTTDTIDNYFAFGEVEWIL